MQEGGNLVLGHLEYSEDLVKEETAVRMVSMFQVCSGSSMSPPPPPPPPGCDNCQHLCSKAPQIAVRVKGRVRY